MRVIGTINKRIDVGYDMTKRIYIMSSSNCITFDDDEMGCLLAVLAILRIMEPTEAIEWFNKHAIRNFEPAPPPAEVRIV